MGTAVPLLLPRGQPWLCVLLLQMSAVRVKSAKGCSEGLPNSASSLGESAFCAYTAKLWKFKTIRERQKLPKGACTAASYLLHTEQPVQWALQNPSHCALSSGWSSSSAAAVSALSLGPADLPAGTAAFFCSLLCLGGRASREYTVAPRYLGLFLERAVCRWYCNVLLVLHSLQAGEPLVGATELERKEYPAESAG